jgi:DNA polymerase/3'-5' exonuclease PolX
MNEKIVLNLQLLIQQMKNNIQPNDQFRIKSIQNAISIIKKIPNEILSIEQLQNTPGIGKGILSRVSEILATGKLSEVKNTISNNDNLIKFQEAIGEVSAKKLYEKGIKSLDALNDAVKKGTITVTHRISLILKYTYGKIKFEDSIPRKEMKKIDASLDRHIKKFDAALEYLMCGSYRREKLTSNDIDILLFHPKNKKVLPEFINFLVEKGFLVDHLTDNINKLKTKYMGFCISTKENVVRRIDIRLVDYKSKFTAIMYFTGSKSFNTQIRSIAKKKGYKLNEYCLEDIKTKNKLYPKSEKEIFDLLEINSIEPKNR